MNLVVSLEQRFERTPDGAVWTRSAAARPFWNRYLEVFESVRVVARVRDVAEAEPRWQRVDGEGVCVYGVPYYVGPWQFAGRFREIREALRNAVLPGDAVIMRVGSPIADLLQPILASRGQPYGVEVVGDPWEVFGPKSLRHPLRPVLRVWCTRKLVRQCRGAAAGSYVTEAALQRRYPLAKGALSISASSIELLPEHFARSPRTWAEVPDPVRVIFVGTLEQLYKSPDVLVEAMARLREKAGCPRLNLTVVGDGRYRSTLERLASRRKFRDQVAFLGHIPAGRAVREQLDASDLFVLPSRGEGLPRAMIEAMARGLPCIGSDSAGIPELIAAEDRVRVGDVAGLAAKIAEVASDVRRLHRMSVRNLERAHRYEYELLRRRRIRFYEELRRRTEGRRTL